MEEETLEHNLLFLDTCAGLTHAPQCAVTVTDLHPRLVDVCGVLLVRGDAKVPPIRRLVPTLTTNENLKSLALAVCQKNPILLEGVTGSGKTSLINELALLTGNEGMH
jgi:midasin